jgi:hypothetical protein
MYARTRGFSFECLAAVGVGVGVGVGGAEHLAGQRVRLIPQYGTFGA